MKIDLSRSTKRVRLWLLTSILALGAVFSFAAGPPGTTNVAILYWDKPAVTVDAWLVYYTTNPALPVASWPLLAAVTNPAPINGGAQLAYTNRTLPPGAYFFTVAASNFWGTAFFPGAVGTPPPLPQPLLLNLGVSPGQ